MGFVRNPKWSTLNNLKRDIQENIFTFVYNVEEENSTLADVSHFNFIELS